MRSALPTFRLLADPTRLRLLRVLSRDRFNGSELTAILGLAQSGVSRHLGLLKDAGLVTEEREGGFLYYRLVEPAGDDPRAPLRSRLDAEFEATHQEPRLRQDEARLQEIL